MLWRTQPEVAEKLLARAQQDVLHRYHFYQQLASLSWEDNNSTRPPHRQLTAETNQPADKNLQATPGSDSDD